MKSLSLLVILASCSINMFAAGVPVDFVLQVNGPDGPLADFPLEILQKGKRLSGVTNQDGVAQVSLDSTISGEIRVAPKLQPGPANEPPSELQARIDQFMSRCRTLSFPLYWEFVVPLDQGQVTRTISVSRGVKLTLQPVGLPQGVRPKFTVHIPGLLMAREKLDSTSGTISRFGVPINTASFGFLEFFEADKPTRVITFAIPASSSDINIGTLTIPALSSNSTVRIRQLWTQSNDARPLIYRGVGMRLGGVTLVSIDGVTIFSNTLRPEDSTNPDGVESSIMNVPSGVYYVLPGSFMATHEQIVVISRLRSNQDLSDRGLPMFTIAAGEEKSIDVNNVDMLNAIHAIEDGN